MWLSLISRRRLTLRLVATALLLALLVAAGALLAPGAAAQTGDDATGTIVFQIVSGGPIYAVDVDTLTGTGGGNLRYLTTGMDPALSPDGRQVAFTRWPTGGLHPLGRAGTRCLRKLVADQHRR